MVNENLNHFYIDYISEASFQEVRRTGKAITLSDLKYLMIEPIENYDAYSFKCYFLEGQMPGFENNEVDFYDLQSKRGFNYVNASALSYRDYYKNYIKREGGVFTFSGITFYRLIDVREMPGNDVQFHLRQITNLTYLEKNRAFMIMPFRDVNKSIFFENSIRTYLQGNLKMKVVRADDFADNDVIIDTIYEEIEKAEIVICEITECNKNVFFEIGYAKGIKKQLIFISEKGKELEFFDVNHIRRIEYDLKEPEQFQERLKDTIKTIRERDGL